MLMNTYMHTYEYIYIFYILAHPSPAMHVAPKMFVTAPWTFQVYEDTLGTFSLNSLL